MNLNGKGRKCDYQENTVYFRHVTKGLEFNVNGTHLHIRYADYNIHELEIRLQRLYWGVQILLISTDGKAVCNCLSMLNLQSIWVYAHKHTLSTWHSVAHRPQTPFPLRDARRNSLQLDRDVHLTVYTIDIQHISFIRANIYERIPGWKSTEDE